MAARYRNENIVRLLLEQGANPDAKCHGGHTTLHRLALLPGVPISETLIDLLLKDRPPLDVPNDEQETPLMIACQHGEPLLAMKLIRHGANIRAIDQHGWTPLHWAAAAGDGGAPIIPQLIANGAELEAKTESLKKTPLHIAARAEYDSSDTIEQLLLAGADKDAGAGYYPFETPLLEAVQGHNKACVASLLKFGANIEANDFETGRRPLHIAAKHGQLEIVKMLLNHGANPTAKTTKFVGSKPSGMSMKYDVSSTQKEAIRTLLKKAEMTWKQSVKK